MGGLLIWVTVVLVIFLFFILSLIFPGTWLAQFNFLSRGQTWLPLFTLVVASIVGLADDFLVVRGWGKYIGGGISFKKRLFDCNFNRTYRKHLVLSKIRMGCGLYSICWRCFNRVVVYSFIYFSYCCMLVWRNNRRHWTDLAGGTFASIFGAFTIISFSLGKIDLAAFCAVISGTLFAFLWFNIPPARFYMGETGIFGAYHSFGGSGIFNRFCLCFADNCRTFGNRSFICNNTAFVKKN